MFDLETALHEWKNAAQRSGLAGRPSLSASELEELYFLEATAHGPRHRSASVMSALARYARYRASIVFPAAQRVSRRIRGRHD